MRTDGTTLNDPNDIKIKEFFNVFEIEFRFNKLNLDDVHYECGVRKVIDNDIKVAFIQAMQKFNFQYVNSIEEIISMTFTITVGDKTDCFPTTIFLSF